MILSRYIDELLPIILNETDPVSPKYTHGNVYNGYKYIIIIINVVVVVVVTTVI